MAGEAYKLLYYNATSRVAVRNYESFDVILKFKLALADDIKMVNIYMW